MKNKINRLIKRATFFSFIWLQLVVQAQTGNSQPLTGDGSRGDTIHVVGHAHMDMNWLWTYSETMQMCNDNLRQVVAFMKEFPDFTMVQSQAAVYNFVEKVDPPLFELVKKYVAEGRLEPVGGMWTESDENMPSGEALSRSFLLGQRYFRSRFGKMAGIGWLPDDFGHISQMPQILKLSGCDFFYFHRCKPYVGTFWWIGPDSSKVLCYANDTYNGGITTDLRNELSKFSPRKGRILQVTGVGDHGGGPTRANINMVHQLDSTPGYPAVKFTTAGDFFRRSLSEMDGRPTHRGEMQFIFEGCYTTVAENKAGNRNNENMLFSGEFFNTLRWLKGDPYPYAEYHDLWETLTFNQFHDILPGSAIYEANREAVARHAELLRKATELRNSAFRKMADEVRFQAGKGQPVVAYNLQPYSRKAVVEAIVFSNIEPFTVKVGDWGDNLYGHQFKPIARNQNNSSKKETGSSGKIYPPTVLVRDWAGRSYTAQIVYAKVTPPGYTTKVQFIADSMPAGGYRTFYIEVSKPGINNDDIPFSHDTFETDFFRVRIDMKSGGIASLYDKRTGTEYVSGGQRLNKLIIYLEDKNGSMSAWTISKIVRKEEVTKIESVKIVETGPVRAGVETVKSWGRSRFIERTYIYRSYPRIEYEMEVHWLETGNDSVGSPMLRAVFPLAYKNPSFFCQVPFDVVQRPVDGKINGREAPSWQKSQSAIYGVRPEDNDGQEIPAQKWVDVTDGKTGIALLNNSKYGHSYHNGELRLTLLRSAGNPDIYPNLGKFIIRYALYPHTGDWKNGTWSEGDDFNIPIYAAESPSLALVKNHASRPEEESLFSVDRKNVVVSGLKASEEGEELIVRLLETEGRETTLTLTLPVPAKSARRLNLVEMPLPGVNPPVISDGKIAITIRPHEIVTLGIK